MRFLPLRFLPLCALCVLPACTLVLNTDPLTEGYPPPADTATDSDTAAPQPCSQDEDCADAHDCTEDLCGSDDFCVHLPRNELCGTLEYCSPTAGCRPTGDECAGDAGCNDGVDCTLDYCELGTCRNIADHSLCENPQPFCLHPARCVPDEGGCVEGAPILCDLPPGACMTSTCNPDDGLCVDGPAPGSDDDSDGFLDADCGGDDCDDDHAAVQPGAAEQCNDVDDNCDGAIDAVFPASVESDLATAADLGAVAVAFDGDRSVVLWTADNTVFAAWVNDEGVSTPLDLSLNGPAGRVLSHPAVTACGDGNFCAAFVSSATGVRELRAVTLVPDADGLVAGADEVLTDAGAGNIPAVSIGFDGERADPGWLVAWAENGTAGRVWMKTHDMGAPLDVFSAAGALSGVSLAAVGEEDYAIGFSGRFTGLSAGDDELFETRIAYDAGFRNADGYPAGPLSTADGDGLYDTDPSNHPAAVVDKQGNRFIAYADSNGFDTGVRVWRSDDGVHESLVDPGSFLLYDLAMVASDNGLGLFTITGSLPQQILHYRHLNPLSPSGWRVDAQLELVTAREEDGLTLLAAAASGRGDRLALVWTFRDDEGMVHLRHSFIGTCTP